MKQLMREYADMTLMEQLAFLAALGALTCAVVSFYAAFSAIGDLIADGVFKYAHAAYVMARDSRDRLDAVEAKTAQEKPE